MCRYSRISPPLWFYVNTVFTYSKMGKHDILKIVEIPSLILICQNQRSEPEIMITRKMWIAERRLNFYNVCSLRNLKKNEAFFFEKCFILPKMVYFLVVLPQWTTFLCISAAGSDMARLNKCLCRASYYVCISSFSPPKISQRSR